MSLNDLMQIEWKRHIRTFTAFNQASDFLRAYNAIVEKNGPLFNDDGTLRSRPIAFAHFTIIVFAIELFLKGLHFSVDKKATGHDLLKLFKSLPASIQNEVKDDFIKRDTSSTDEKFIRSLTEHKDSFEHWRYFHEKGQGKFDEIFCSHLANSLHDILEKYVVKIHSALPDWKKI